MDWNEWFKEYMYLWFWYCQLPSIVLVPLCTSSRNVWAFTFPNTVCCQSNASQITILYNFFFFCHAAWLARSQFFNPGPWQWKPRILTTRPPGNPPTLCNSIHIFLPMGEAGTFSYVYRHIKKQPFILYLLFYKFYVHILYSYFYWIAGLKKMFLLICSSL